MRINDNSQIETAEYEDEVVTVKLFSDSPFSTDYVFEIRKEAIIDLIELLTDPPKYRRT